MKVEVNGLIIREMDIGESGKVITILTAEKGIITAIVKNFRSIKNKNTAVAQMFAYCRFTLYVGKKGYILDEAEVHELFFGLRSDLEALSLAGYFCELCLGLSPEIQNATDFLKLFLNSLAYLINKKREPLLIKSIFEIRGCSISGYMPNLVCCDKCKTYDSDEMHFLINQGILKCSKCVNEDDHQDKILLKKGILAALRYIVYSPTEKLFSFSISNDSIFELSVISERYVLSHINNKFKSLDFYKKIINLSL